MKDNKVLENDFITDAMRDCLLAIADGKVKCDMDYPNFRKIKVEILGVDLKNIHWKSINVRILEKGLNQEIETFEDSEFGYDDEPNSVLVKKEVPFTEAWVNVEWLSNYT